MITGGVQRTSRERLYDELGLHPLVKRRWHTKLVLIVIRLLPDYFSSYSRKLFTNIIISFYYKTFSNKNKILQNTIFSILYKRME